MNRESADKPAKPSIVVLGSINMDLVARCSELPRAGETITAFSFSETNGGKGANQAVAASRAGGNVQMIGRVGDDGFADRLLANLDAERVARGGVQTTAGTPSGVALITVANDGENQIVVVPGANGQVTVDDVNRFAECIAQCDALMLQLEVPQAAVLRAIEIAGQAGCRIVLDPAPATSNPPAQLCQVDLICPNETEAALLTGVNVDTEEGLSRAADRLHQMGAKTVAITLGEKGVYLSAGEEVAELIEPNAVDAVDATAAGDAFAAAVTVRWCEGESLRDAVRWGTIAGSLAAASHGAQPSLPTRQQVDEAAH